MSETIRPTGPELHRGRERLSWEAKLDRLANSDPNHCAWTDFGGVINMGVPEDVNQQFLAGVFGQKEPDELIKILPGTCEVIQKDPEEVVVSFLLLDPPKIYTFPSSYPRATDSFELRCYRLPERDRAIWEVRWTTNQGEIDGSAVTLLPELS